MFETEEVKYVRKRGVVNMRKKANENVIARNSVEMQNRVEMPSVEDVIEEARQLINNKFHDKKGRKLTFRHRNSDKHWTKLKVDQRVFVEDHIEIYKRFLRTGFMTPIVTGDSAGGRVVDSFNLMPSWIRNLIKINGRRIKELDYKALHPNIAVSIYGGNIGHVSHEYIASTLGVSKMQIKKEHLSFFNHEIENMFKSCLYKWYKTSDRNMLYRILKDKEQNGYKATSRKMFAKEVEIMTDVIAKLNNEGIFVGYVFDALFCDPLDLERVRDVMNEEILKKGVKTFAE